MYIASASTTIKFHDFSSGNIVHNYQPGTKVEGPIRSISWSRDGNWLVLVPHSGVTEIVSVKEQLKLLKTISNIDEPTCAAFQNNSKKNLALGTKNGLVLVYDIKTDRTKNRFQRCSSQITHIQFTAKDTHIVAGCKNGDVMIFNNTTNSPPSTLRVPKSNSINCLKTNQSKRNLILGGSNEGVLVVWDSNVNKPKFSFNAHEAPVNSVAFSPFNSDLIVSTGSDRQFSFFDIIENKCIATVAVENSMTAVDFSPDGTYFVMASQNGKVHIYDSRNVQEPVNCFHAHKSSVRNLAFQKVVGTGNSNASTISVESTALVRSASDVSSKRNSDLFGLFIPTVDSSEDPKKSVPSFEGGDSFMAALDLDKNNTMDSLTQGGSSILTKATPRLPTILSNSAGDIVPTPKASKSLDEKSVCGKTKQFSSTPVFPGQEFNFDVSPNLENNNPEQLQSISSLQDLKSVIKESIREELSVVVKEVKKDIEFQAMNTTYQLRKMLLDIQMALVKEFIKTENYFNRVLEDMKNDPGDRFENNNMVDENEQLRSRIQFLEEQLRNLSVNKSNGSA